MLKTEKEKRIKIWLTLDEDSCCYNDSAGNNMICDVSVRDMFQSYGHRQWKSIVCWACDRRPVEGDLPREAILYVGKMHISEYAMDIAPEQRNLDLDGYSPDFMKNMHYTAWKMLHNKFGIDWFYFSIYKKPEKKGPRQI